MKNFTLYILLLISAFAKAQDTRFSMFFLAPHHLNPALTGSGRHEMRLMANVRNQWSPVLRSQAYNSYSAAMDLRFPMSNGYIGVGTSLLGDKAGTSEFQKNNAKMSLSYAKIFRGNRKKYHSLIAGFEGGLTSMSLNVDGLRFLQQFNKSDVYDSNLAAPIFQNEYRNLNFGDVSAGLVWTTVMAQYYSFYIGGAIHHVNRPNVSFANVKRLLPRYTLNFGGEYYLGDKRWALLPNIIGMKQGKSIELNSGLALRRTLQLEKGERPYKAFQVGAWIRLNNKLENSILADAFIFYTRFDFDRYTIGFSYDTNTSSLRLAHVLNGSFELAVHYSIAPNKKKTKPCFDWNKTQVVW